MKRKLKPWVKEVLEYTIICFVIIFLLFLICVINNFLEKDMENHIEKVSYECALKGYGIKAYYTNSGDKFYTCNGGYHE